MKYIMMVAVTFIIALAATPLAIKLAHRIGAMDLHKGKSRMHAKH